MNRNNNQAGQNTVLDQLSHSDFWTTSLQSSSRYNEFRGMAEAVAFWHDLAPKLASSERVVPNFEVWNLLPRDLAFIRQFLGRLRETADFKRGDSRPRLASRVCDLLQAMEQTPELREICSDCIRNALETCDDRVILAMNQVETAIRVHQAEHSDASGAALKNLVLGFMRLDIVQAQAREKVTTLLAGRPRSILYDPFNNCGIDEIEVSLAYESGLRETLQLPVSTETMVYREAVTKVYKRDLKAAQEVVELAMQDASLVAGYLQASVPWQRHERREAAKQWSWQGLAPTPWPENLRADELQCVISQMNFADLSEPVLCPYNNTWHVYEARKLLTYWVEHGTDAFHNKLNLTSLRRPDAHIDESPKKKQRFI